MAANVTPEQPKKAVSTDPKLLGATIHNPIPLLADYLAAVTNQTALPRLADLEIGDTAGLETCGTCLRN
jgi:hypothetical protein